MVAALRSKARSRFPPNLWLRPLFPVESPTLAENPKPATEPASVPRSRWRTSPSAPSSKRIASLPSLSLHSCRVPPLRGSSRGEKEREVHLDNYLPRVPRSLPTVENHLVDIVDYVLRSGQSQQDCIRILCLQNLRRDLAQSHLALRRLPGCQIDQV